MKIQIRKGCFETNSSSTHAFVLDTHKKNEYTQDHLDAFTENIIPYTREEWGKWDDPIIITDLKEKIRYLWTVFVYNNIQGDYTPAYRFMGMLQRLVPYANFVLRFNTDTSSEYYNVCCDNTCVYLEDADYIFNDNYTPELDAWTEDQLREFLFNGCIIFGDRDRVDYYGDSLIESLIDQSQYKLITKISG